MSNGPTHDGWKIGVEKPSGEDDQRRPSGKTAADRIVSLAEERYRFGRTPKGDLFAVEKNGPNIARMLRGGVASVRSELATMHREACGLVASSSAVADAMSVIEGMAQRAPQELVFLRVAELPDRLIIDLGDPSGRCVEVTPSGWNTLAKSPVLFRRTELTGEMPEPKRGGNLLQLRELLNVTDECWPLVTGWMVAAFFATIAHPVLLLTGEQGTGKSTAARLIGSLIDPSPAPLRSPPRDEDRWQVCAAGSWLVCVDNVSSIPDWLSDVLCRAVTGDARIVRRLYSDDGLAVLEFRRVLMLTGIDVQALRGDLGSRLVLVDLERIDSDHRRSETDLLARFDELRPLILGALFDLTVQALAWIPETQLESKPRMADFARVLAAIDQTETFTSSSLEKYIAQDGNISQTVIDSNPVAELLAEMLHEERRFEGTTSLLLARLRDLAPKPTPKSWPVNAQQMGSLLRRITPALLQQGFQIEEHRTGSARNWTLQAPPREEANPSLIGGNPA